MRGGSLLNLLLECPEAKDPSEWDKSTDVEDIQAQGILSSTAE